MFGVPIGLVAVVIDSLCCEVKSAASLTLTPGKMIAALSLAL